MKKFTFVKQKDSMQCGVACLKMICQHYGKNINIDYLENLCNTTIQGVSILNLCDTAEHIGFHTIAGRLTIQQLIESTKPVVLHWHQNHFVVLYRVTGQGKKFYIADPGIGLIKYSRHDFEKAWISSNTNNEDRGIALLLQPTPSFFSHDFNLEKVETRSFRFLFGYIKQYKHYFSQIILGLLIGSVLQLVFPFLTQSIVDVGIFDNDINFILLVLVAQLMLTLGYASVGFIRRWILLHVGIRINISLLSDFFIKLLKLPMNFFDTKLMGDIMQRMNDHQRIQTFLTSSVLEITFSIISFIVLGIVLFFYNPIIFSILILESILYAIWTIHFMSRRKVLDYMLFEKRAKNSNNTYQFITSMQEIKLQDCERRRRWEWEDVQADMFEVDIKLLKLQQTQEAGSLLINEIKNIVITILSAIAVIDGEMTLGMMLAVQYIIGQLNTPVKQLMNFLYSLQDVKISLERINDIQGQTEEDAKYGNNTDFSRGGDICLSNISFRYDLSLRKNILNNISIIIPEGKVTAIVGASGSGKSTLLKLILGFYPATSGNITIGGINILEYNIRWWRRQCGVVMQDGVIFSESIAHNIAVNDEEIDMHRLEEAAQMAGITDFINSLPLKYNTIIGRDGIGISQGQRQRILIARAIYKHPKYIFLDEATNSLDANNERRITENLENFYKHRTVFIIAHRLSTVKKADQIIVLDNGEVIETGNHNQLISKKGKYFHLVKDQLELEA